MTEPPRISQIPYWPPDRIALGTVPNGKVLPPWFKINVSDELKGFDRKSRWLMGNVASPWSCPLSLQCNPHNSRLEKTPLLAFPKLMDFPLYMPCNDLLEIDFAEPGLRV